MPSKYTIGHNASSGYVRQAVTSASRSAVISEISVADTSTSYSAHDLLDVPGGYPLGVERKDLLVEAQHTPLMRADPLRLERPLAIAGRGQSQFAQLPRTFLRECPLRRSAERRGGLVAAAASGEETVASGAFRGLSQRLASEMNVPLGVEHPFQSRFHHQPHQAVEGLRSGGLAGDFPGELFRPRP
jgi:hypothetical protein